MCGVLQGGLNLKYGPVLRDQLGEDPAQQMSLLSDSLLSERSQPEFPVSAKYEVDEGGSEVVAGPGPGQTERLEEVEDELSHGVNLPATAVQSVAEPAVAEVGMLQSVLCRDKYQTLFIIINNNNSLSWILIRTLLTSIGIKGWGRRLKNSSRIPSSSIIEVK